jgi:hypothetical protein
MKKYLLIIFGNFESDNVTQEIALTITPLVDSPNLKFQKSNGGLMFHFASEISQEEIHDYVLGSLFDITNSFVLTEFTDRVSIHLPDGLKEHLLDLENTSDDIHINMTPNLRSMNEDEEDDDFVALLLEGLKKNVKKPTLDYILDKIASDGFESLSQFEKDTLESYSK